MPQPVEFEELRVMRRVILKAADDRGGLALDKRLQLPAGRLADSAPEHADLGAQSVLPAVGGVVIVVGDVTPHQSHLRGHGVVAIDLRLRVCGERARSAGEGDQALLPEYVMVVDGSQAEDLALFGVQLELAGKLVVEQSAANARTGQRP
jgi:hypothetical protein